MKSFYNKKEEAIKQLIKETDPKLLEEVEDSSEYESDDEISERAQINNAENNNETDKQEEIKEEEKSNNSTNADKINKFYNQQRENQNIEMTNLQREDDIQILNEEEIHQSPDSHLNKSIKQEEEVIRNRKLSEEMNDITPYLEKIEKKRKKKENIPEGPIK